MIEKIGANANYIPPRSLGEGLQRVKDAFGITKCIAINKGHRLYGTNNRSTVYMTIGELHKTGKVVPAEKECSYKDCDTYAGTVLRIRRSEPCGKNNAKPNQLMQLMRTRFYSDKVANPAGGETKPLFAVTDFKILNSEEGKPVVVYGCGKYAGSNKPANFVKEIKSQDVPKEFTGVKSPDGNVVYYLKDTVRDGERSVEMKMFEAGIDVPIL
jgi:hypothetical protein